MSYVPGLLSILVPLYNEEELVGESLRRVLAVELPGGLSREVIVVDDGSRDAGPAVVEELARRHPDVIRFVRHPKNRGKGAAIRTAIEHARGEFSLIQDADLEYDPQEYPKLMGPLLEGKADAVFGSRFVASGERRVLYFWHSVGNQMLTLLCNMVSDLNLTDMETCYKAFRTSLVKSIPLRSERFGIEPELTIKLAQRRARIYEVPISYYGRTYDEGKKIGLKDAFQALGIILRYGLSRDVYHDKGPEILDVLAGAPRFNRWMADTVRPFLGPTVLEIGAGIGNLTAQLSPGRERYVATDIDEEHLARLRGRFQFKRQVEVRQCDVRSPEHVECMAGSMDSVVALNVVEHVEDDRLALRNIRSALKPGGRAVVLVPEGMSVYGTLDESLGHYRRYAKQELVAKMEEAGLRVERVVEFNRVTRPGWFVNGRLLKRRTFSPVQIWVFDRLVALWRRLDRVLPWKPTSLIAVGVRND